MVIEDVLEAKIFRIKALVKNPLLFRQSGYKVYYYEKLGNEAVG